MAAINGDIANVNIVIRAVGLETRTTFVGCRRHRLSLIIEKFLDVLYCRIKKGLYAFGNIYCNVPTSLLLQQAPLVSLLGNSTHKSSTFLFFSFSMETINSLPRFNHTDA